MKYTTLQLAHITQSKLYGCEQVLSFSGLVYDSRQITFPEESVFFAIKTSKADGHAYLQSVYEKGVRIFVVETLPNLSLFEQAAFVLVSNTVQALQALAAHHRNKFTMPIVGITGSNGKTIVKEWLSQLLDNELVVTKNTNSFNSQIGVAVSVWKLNKYSQIGIFEAGISTYGEMQYLAKLIRPTIGIFTNIGDAHDDGFARRGDKIQEKLKLFEACNKLFYSLDYVDINSAIQSSNIITPKALRTWTFDPKKKATLVVQQQVAFDYGLQLVAQYLDQNISLHIPFTDTASIENAVICWLFLLDLGWENHKVQSYFAELKPVNMRIEEKEGINFNTIINDSYSFDLNSLMIALDFLHGRNQNKTQAVILSDLPTSDRNKAEKYAQVADLLQRYDIEQAVLIGADWMTYSSLLKVKHKTHFTDTAKFLKSNTIDQWSNKRILIKGARSFEFEKIDAALAAQTHETVLEIDLDAMIYNLNQYRSMLKPSTKIMCMVKALGYGAGSFQVAQALQFHRVDYLAVAYVDEGIALRKNGILLPIMVLNPEPNTFANIIKYRLEPVIYSLQKMEHLLKYLALNPVAQALGIHIECNTGMNRLGFNQLELQALLAALNTSVGQMLTVCSVFSHLTSSEETQSAHNEYQINLFDSCYHFITQQLDYKPIKHILNTAGIVNYSQAQYDMVRLGIGLYGVDSAESMQQKLTNVSTLKSVISQIHKLNAGDTVGYNQNGKVAKNTYVATVAIGYADGLRRSFGNGVTGVYVNGNYCKIIGNVCMDMLMVDLGQTVAKEGDEVIVFGAVFPLTKYCQQANIIPYELLTGISERVKRVYLKS